MNNDETFYIKARRCKRCGGILTSKKAIEDGYGHTCKIKTAEILKRSLDKAQISVFDILEGDEKND